MKINARELEGAALEYSVAITQGWVLDPLRPPREGQLVPVDQWATSSNSTLVNWLAYSTDWSQGGPLIERNLIDLHTNTGEQHGEHERWYAVVPTSASGSRGAMGSTPLIAAGRALVFARLGEMIDVPDELLDASAKRRE